MSQKENQLQKTVVRYLLSHGDFAYSVYNGATMTVRGHFKPNHFDRPSGFPDVLWIRNGKTRYLEIKTKEGRLSDNQRVMHDKLMGHGVEVYVIRSLDEIVTVRTLVLSEEGDRGQDIKKSCHDDSDPDAENT